jgi:hypothetical protein
VDFWVGFTSAFSVSVSFWIGFDHDMILLPRVFVC